MREEKYFNGQERTESFKAYMRNIMEVPLLTREEEAGLARRVRGGDAGARIHMIRANLRLVVKIAHDYVTYGLPIQDLISEGNIGLMRAVDRFDPCRGTRFSTYACWWIKQSIRRALAHQSKIIRLPVHVIEKLSRVRRVTGHMAEALGRNPTEREVAWKMGMSHQKMAGLMAASSNPVSLDTPADGGGSSPLVEVLPDESLADPLETLRAKMTHRDVAGVIRRLNERERMVISARFGMDGAQPVTLKMIGRRFNVTRERIRQIQNGALRKMRRALQNCEKGMNVERKSKGSKPMECADMSAL